MNYILVGITGFLIIHLCDPVAIKRIPVVKTIVWVLGSSLLVYALVMISLRPDRLPLPIWSTWLGWALLSVSTLLFLCSLFISLPFRKTYLATGVGEKLITGSLYALTRHPGVPWYILLMLSLILASKSALLLIAAPIFILLDIAAVVLQDMFFFGRMFADYESYRRQTPMLVPNRKSLRAFINSLRQARVQDEAF
jgi:protein-S-isoprenylcysteine O-methyltransferase Ste14